MEVDLAALSPLDEVTLDALFRSAPVGLSLVDAEKRYVRVNDRWAALNGVPAEDHIGRTPRDVIPDVAAAVESVLNHVLESKLPMTDLEVSPPTGEKTEGTSVLVSLYPLVSEGVALGVLGIATIVSD